MSEGEQDAIIGRTVQEIVEFKRTLACYRAKAARFRQALQRAVDALKSEDDDYLIHVEDCPSSDQIMDVWSGIRRNRNLIQRAEDHLKEMAPGLLKHLRD